MKTRSLLLLSLLLAAGCRTSSVPRSVRREARQQNALANKRKATESPTLERAAPREPPPATP